MAPGLFSDHVLLQFSKARAARTSQPMIIITTFERRFARLRKTIPLGRLCQPRMKTDESFAPMAVISEHSNSRLRLRRRTVAAVSTGTHTAPRGRSCRGVNMRDADTVRFA